MSGVQSKAARFQKEQREKPSADRERKMATPLCLKHDVPATMMKQFNALMEMQDAMFAEMRETYKNDIKEVLLQRAAPWVKLLEERIEQQGDAVSERPKPGEKVEEEPSGTDEDAESLTVRSKEKSKPERKQDKAKLNSNPVVKPSQERAGDALGRECERRRESSSLVAGLERETVKNADERPAKEPDCQKEENRLQAPDESMWTEGAGATLRLAADFSAATLAISRQWGQVFRLLRERALEPELQCTVKLAFKCDGEAKIFSDLHSLRQFASRKPFLKELLKDVFPQNETRSEGGRRNELQERLGKTLGDTKHEARRIASDSLSFLFIKEVQVASPEVKTYKEEIQTDKETLKKQEASRLEGEKEISEKQGEETSEGETSELGEEEGSESEEEEEGSESEEEEESSESEEEEEDSGEDEEGEENSEMGKKEEAFMIHEARGSTFQGLTVAEKHCVEKITRSAEEIGLINLVVDSESEEEVNRKTSSQTKKKETFHGLKELAFSYLVWDSKDKKLVKCQEGGAAAMSSQRFGIPCLTLYLASPSESLGAGSDGPKICSCTKLSVPSQATPLLMNTEKGRCKTPQIEELMGKEADWIHETEENFRRGVIGVIRQMQREVENIRNLYFSDVLNMKSSMDDLNSLACMIEARVNEQEDAMEGLTRELAKEIIGKERLREREDRLRSSNIRVIGIPEKENRENGAEDIIKEIIEENFAELEDQSLEIVSAHRIPNSVDEHRLTPRHILVKFWNTGDKQRILKASRAKKEITYRGAKIRLTADLSPSTIDARSQWSSIIKILQEEGFQPRILYPAKLAFDFKGKTKIFLDVEEFKKFILDIPYLKELFNNIP